MKIKLVLISILFLSFIFEINGSVVINEVFYNSEGNDTGNEWLELYNNGDTEIDLSGWLIEKAGKQFIQIYTFPDFFIRSRSYLVIGESEVESAHIFTSLAFGNGGSHTDGIRLRDKDGEIIDTILYSEPNTNNLIGDSGDTSVCENVTAGHSLARVKDGVDSNDSSDWYEAIYTTPGSSNIEKRRATIDSVELYNNELALEVFTVIRNLSTQEVDKGELILKILYNGELKTSEEVSSILGGEVVSYCYNVNKEHVESAELKIELCTNSDIDIVDNLWIEWINPVDKPVVISEVMYNSNSSMGEWIELMVKKSIVDYDLTIMDESGRKADCLLSGYPGDFIVIAENSLGLLKHYSQIDSAKVYSSDGWASFNNTGDKISIYHDGKRVDFLEYCGGDADKDQSIEYNFAYHQWQASKSPLGATPTEDCYIYTNPYTDVSGIQIINRVISKRRNKNFTFKYSDSETISKVKISLYSIKGQKLFDVITSNSKENQNIFSWDGQHNSQRLKSGVYPAIVTVMDSSNKVIEEKKVMITVNY